ncbi:MAG: adenosylcobinamide-phosphate synthase CbiB [Candidatus Omnitrophota bacterium]
MLQPLSPVWLVPVSFLADLLFGDPEGFPHPVRGIGKMIFVLERKLLGTQKEKRKRINGVFLFFLVTGTVGSGTYLALKLSAKLHPLLGTLCWIYFGYTALAIKDLSVKAGAVRKKLETGSINEARQELSRIVGRDTESLDREQIITATVESIAESTNDGIVAPLFYLFIAGPVGAMVYKAVNTLDSMVGHQDEKYREFGWFSARADDVANFIPARISGFIIAVSAFVAQGNILYSLRITFRDGPKHSSPNSGISEAAMAGALGISLGGPAWYAGEFSPRPYLGETRRTVTAERIREALDISLFASFLALILGILIQTH